MDITAFVHANRERAFLSGDYATYRRQVSKQLLKLRRNLGRTTPKNHKFTPKAPVTPQDVGNDKAFVRLQILSAERAWSHAMAMKSAHNDEGADEAITGSTRSHILSRLRKAARYAAELVAILTSKDASKATDVDILEAEAYSRVALGIFEFEKHFPHRYQDTAAQKQAWALCLASFSEAHVAYTALLRSTKKELFKEVIAGTVDPTIRYAAYQSRISRTVAVATVAKQSFRRSESRLLGLITSLDPNALADEKQAAQKTGADPVLADIPTSITWRGRTAPIADAAIGQALAVTNSAARQLSETVDVAIKDPKPNTPTLLAAAYDPVLTAAADTVDAVRRALSDLAKEGVGEADSRVQDLRVADLAANYALISWRVGRNRIMTSSAPPPKGSSAAPYALDDGLFFAPLPPAPPKRRHGKKNAAKDADAMDVDGDPTQSKATAESVPHQLARLTTRHTLLTATLQSLDSLGQLPGAARDAALTAELDAQRAYFSALRLLAAAASHRALARDRDALALLAAARAAVADLSPADLNSTVDASSAPQLAVRPAQLHALQSRTALLTERQRGLVALQRHMTPLRAAASDETVSATTTPLVEALHAYPAAGRADLTRLVEYPPRLRAVPVKPVFLDLAFNYIEYPGAERAPAAAAPAATGTKKGQEQDDGEGDKRQSRGWFGFGRR